MDCERVVVLVPIVGAAHATDDAAEALKFFAWAYAKGGQMAEELDFVPMPAKLSARFRRTGRRSRTTKDSRCSLRPAERQPPARPGFVRLDSDGASGFVDLEAVGPRSRVLPVRRQQGEPAQRAATRHAIDQSFASAFRFVMLDAAALALAAAAAGAAIR